MRLLLDECIPRRLRLYFPDKHEISPVAQLGWAGTRNSILIHLAALHGFDALFTVVSSLTDNSSS